MNPPDGHRCEETLRSRYQRLRNEHPKLRIRDAARRLGVAEADLLSLDLGQGVFRLIPDLQGLFSRLASVGPLMVLVRNDPVVLEVTCLWASNGTKKDWMALESPGRARLSVLTDALAESYAVDLDGRKSVQCFDQSGHALVKFFFDEGAGAVALQRVAQDLIADDQSEREVTVRFLAASDDQIQRDVGQSQRLEDRIDASVWPSMEDWLRTSAAASSPIHIRCENSAARLEVKHRVNRIVRTGEWLNILDPEVNLHVLDARCNVPQRSESGATAQGQLKTLRYEDAAENEVLWLSIASGEDMNSPWDPSDSAHEESA